MGSAMASKTAVTGFDEIVALRPVRLGDPDHGRGPAGQLPLTAEMLLETPRAATSSG